jgi:hypothetical protein
MNQFPPSPRVFLSDRFKFFQIFAEIFASQGGPLVSTTSAANLSTSFASVVHTCGKFATGVNDAGGKFATVQRGRWKIATSINDTSGKFATGLIDTDGKQWEQLSNC